ncbi:response regulator transcription factor [Sphingobium boeckii]|uniref:Two-component system response regulator FixJ n=1 Tax=Sphingobium boeckii TaxID=1082345 RepID=A0A7W9AGP4_9SPHN|nr:response regulator [Sphingobium boeckii]MBB5685243.1 two-component system response regulator FixJ [Sphingobium boeckii]
MTDRALYIVDDNDDVRLSLHSLMATQTGFAIRCFSSGDEFLKNAPDLAPGCILLDLNMPGANGLEVLKEIAGPPSRFAAIILTGQGDITLAVHAMKLNAIDFLEKPCDPLSLIQAVDRAFLWLEKHNEISSKEADARVKLARLSPRERDVLRGLIDGLSNKVIAHQLDISPRTVEIYRAKVMEKLDVRSLSEALRVAFASGLFPD